VLALLVFCAGCDQSERGAKEPWVGSPALALETLSAKPLYYNGPARPWLVARKPELLEPDDRGKESARGDTFAQATQNPKLFRQLNRQQPFAAVLLVGDPSQYRPLLDHLLETRDWKLAHLDHTSLIFRREVPAPWEAARLDSLRDRLKTVSPRVRARVLADVAVKLVAVRELGAARKVAEEAQQASGEAPEVWSAQAAYRMALGEWKAAIENADKALAIDPEFMPALGCKAQSLYATKRFAEAYVVSSKLIAKMPDDPGILFYHAKIAHEAKHLVEEVRALRYLIALAGKAQRPDTGYRVYLGQALASSGDGEPALVEFRRALADPELPAEQRKFAQQCVDRLHDLVESKK
jgi:tetratricopeptide (TPR) repeat protein